MLMKRNEEKTKVVSGGAGRKHGVEEEIVHEFLVASLWTHIREYGKKKKFQRLQKERRKKKSFSPFLVQIDDDSFKGHQFDQT